VFGQLNVFVLAGTVAKLATDSALMQLAELELRKWLCLFWPCCLWVCLFFCCLSRCMMDLYIWVRLGALGRSSSLLPELDAFRQPLIGTAFLTKLGGLTYAYV
jgi:hypothetical protein